MTDELKKIVASSTFTLQSGRFIVAKVKTAPTIDDHFMVSKDNDETTVVTKEENLGSLDLIEKNKDFYVAFELKISLPFYATGFLGAVTGAMGDGGMNNLVISTFSKDYLFVREEHLEKATQALLDLGLKTS